MHKILLYNKQQDDTTTKLHFDRVLTQNNIYIYSYCRRHRTTWKEWRARNKRLSISGPITVNDMFLEVKRDSQLLQTQSQSRGSNKDTLKKSDKNIYDEIKGEKYMQKNLAI